MRNLGLGDLGFLAAVGGVAYDADALAYMTAVETADGQVLETAVKDAINAFVVGCKTDGTWPALKASCITAGARTINGALVSLVGTAPTRTGTEGGWDYNRKTGLKGNGSNNTIVTNRNNNQDPQNSKHLAFFASEMPTSATVFTSVGWSNTSGETTAGAFQGNLWATVNSNGWTGSGLALGSPAANRMICITRNSSASITAAVGQTTATINKVSELPASGVFSLMGSAFQYNATRIAFYSIGEAVSATALNARVTTLINALAAAIP